LVDQDVSAVLQQIECDEHGGMRVGNAHDVLEILRVHACLQRLESSRGARALDRDDFAVDDEGAARAAAEAVKCLDDLREL
jgi:hypothetical protein